MKCPCCDSGLPPSEKASAMLAGFIGGLVLRELEKSSSRPSKKSPGSLGIPSERAGLDDDRREAEGFRYLSPKDESPPLTTPPAEEKERE